MAQHMLAFVSEDGHDILAHFSRSFMDLLRPRGIVGHVIDMKAPGWSDAARQLMRGDVVCAWGFAGIGAEIELRGENVWEALKIPFVSAHFDPPAWKGRNHFVNSRYVANGYGIRDWLDFQRRWIRSPQLSAMIPRSIFANARRDETPWAKRAHRMVFVKSGEDPEAIRRRWAAGWPVRLRAVLEDAGAALCRHGTQEITGIVMACLEAHDLFLEERKDLMFAVLAEVDRFVRAARATAMARALHALPADIFGPGWDHLRATEGRARFHGGMGYRALHDLYADSQFVVNTTPNFTADAHERVLDAFAARACAVSDENAFSRARLRHLPTYRGIEWHEPDLADKLAAIYHDPTDFGALTQPALDLIERDYDPVGIMNGILELAEVLRFRKSIDDFGY